VFNKKKGEMGIGTLVLFIAMILVAAIAAGVLIQTATNLQSKALETGSRSTRQVSTALSTILLYGEDAGVGSIGDVEALFQNVKLVAGSEEIKLNDTLISVDLSNVSSDLTYDDTDNCNDTTIAAGKYAVTYLKNGTNNRDGYIVTGDVLQFCYALPRSVAEDEMIRVNIVPKVGSVMTTKVTTPPVMITSRVFLYP
jgi:flagellin-like protein